MQREPVVITNNNRPVGIMISIEDAGHTLIPEMFMGKEAGYDEWFQNKVSKPLASHKSDESKTSPHEEVMMRIWERIKAKSV